MAVVFAQCRGDLGCHSGGYILTEGGSDNSTITVVQFIHNMAFHGPDNLGRRSGHSDGHPRCNPQILSEP